MYLLDVNILCAKICGVYVTQPGSLLYVTRKSCFQTLAGSVVHTLKVWERRLVLGVTYETKYINKAAQKEWSC